MLFIVNIVKPILEEMGLFNGKEVSVKEVFDKYLKIDPNGIGPLGVFKGIIAYKLRLTVKEKLINNELVDFVFIYNSNNVLLDYDPRNC